MDRSMLAEDANDLPRRCGTDNWMMDANSGEPWSEMDIADLTHSLAYGDTFADTASFLCRDEDEVRQKANELGLVEHPGKRVRAVR